MPTPPPNPSIHWNRRNFLKTATLASGAVAFGVPTLLRGQNLNSKLNFAAIGTGGKGASDTNSCAGENIVALCDVDSSRYAEPAKKYPNAKLFRDFRKMFDELGKGIDAVTVSTPDHFHAIAASAAMRLGKHVYCQKPLTQTIFEARYLLDLARTSGVVTQMGNQGSAGDGLRRAVECIQSGIIGQVHEVHIWTNRPIWPQGMDRPVGSDPVPETLDWDIWLGPAPVRPYKTGVYNPFKWRGWQDFGTGALGDMACHTVNMPFRALCLGYPTEVVAEALGGINKESYPTGSKIRFQFPARKNNVLAFDPMTLWWYDGKLPGVTKATKADKGKGSNKPPQELTADIAEMLGDVPGSGCLLIGDKGKIFSPDDYGAQFFIKRSDEKKIPAFHQTSGGRRRAGDTAACAQGRSFPRMDFGHQGRQAAGLLLPVRRRCAAHGNHVAWLRCAARRQENRVGRAEYEGHQLPRSRALYQAREPRRLDACLMFDKLF